MAGHSKFKNIQHRKGAQDKKRAKIFTRLVREIITAAKSGQPDPEFNPRLRTAIITAKYMNLPKERIDKAIASGSGDDDSSTTYHEIRYEGYASGGVPIIVEALTDNKNRTASDVRASFNKYGGNLGETGCVSFMFDRLGIIIYDSITLDESQLLEGAIDIGAIDAESNEISSIFYTSVEDFNVVISHAIEKFGVPSEACIGWRPQTPHNIDDQEKYEKISKLINALEEIDDVQQVFSSWV